MKVLFLSLNRSIRGPNTIAPKINTKISEVSSLKGLGNDYHTNKRTNTPTEVNHSGSSKIPETQLPEPAVRSPTPVGGDGVGHARDDDAEDDVAIEVAPFGDGSGHDGGAGGREGALEKEHGIVLKLEIQSE